MIRRLRGDRSRHSWSYRSRYRSDLYHISAGGVQIEVNCVKGASCEDLTRELERSLGQSHGRAIKEEFYEQHDDQSLHLGNAGG